MSSSQFPEGARIDKRVLVTGAGGFVGRSVLTALRQAGATIRAFVRRPLPAPESIGLEMALGDIRDAAAVRAAVAGCDAVVHLAAAKMDEAESDDVNVGGARRLVDACREFGCRRVVVVSTQSAKIARQGAYGRTKAEADVIFHASGLDVTVLLPSVVYGESLEGIFGTLHKAVTRLPVVPVLGDGRWVSAPVYVGDVAGAVVACLTTPASVGRDYDIGGPESLTFDDLLTRIAVQSGAGHRRAVHVPFVVALAAAKALSTISRRPLITVSNVLGSNQNTAIDIVPARRDLGFFPLGLDEGLRRVLPLPVVSDSVLHAEARHFGRYLVGVDVESEMLARYAAAHRRLLSGPVDPLTAFTRRQPAWLAFLDAAASLAGSRTGLRQRVLLMTAILEASPRYVSTFLPAACSLPSAARRLAWHGALAVVRGAIGMPAYLVLRERR